MGRPVITTVYNQRFAPGDNCMLIIQTGFYDDTQVFEDGKIWRDNGIIGTGYINRPIITTNWI